MTFLEGWCSPEKTEFLKVLVRRINPKILVELGVYGGASLIPMAENVSSDCEVFAVDPWKKGPTLEGYTPKDENYVWWNELDLEKIYNGFIRALKERNLTNCTILRTMSTAAVNEFKDNTIDLLHQDGNHSEKVSVEEVELYLPKMKRQSCWIMDDTDWDTTLKAQELLKINGYTPEAFKTYTCFTRY